MFSVEHFKNNRHSYPSHITFSTPTDSLNRAKINIFITNIFFNTVAIHLHKNGNCSNTVEYLLDVSEKKYINFNSACIFNNIIIYVILIC